MADDCFYEIISPNCSLIPLEIDFLNWKNYTMDYHKHSAGSLELNYIVDGECYYDIAGENFCLSKRNLLLVNGSVPHKLISPNTCLNMSINCFQIPLTPNMGTLDSVLSAAPQLNQLFHEIKTGYVVKNARHLFGLLQEIYNEFTGSNNQTYLNLLTNKVLFDLQKLLTEDSGQTNYYIEKAKNFIGYHYFSIQNIDEIAEAIALNKTYLQKIFKDNMQITIWNYLTRLRLEKAVYYLVYTNTAISDIDELIGIHSRQNFYILFKKNYGISPLEYRKKYKKEEQST